MINILHNSRCSKSREALQYLETQHIEFDIRNYLDEPLSVDEINAVLAKLGLNAKDIIRTNENLWKENFKGKEYTEEELISILSENPKLIQRPIIIKGEKAVIGRPLENVIELLND